MSDETIPPSLTDMIDRLALLREEHKIAAEGLTAAKRDENTCAVNLANAEVAFARRVYGYLGEYGTNEMVSLTQTQWRRRVAEEK